MENKNSKYLYSKIYSQLKQELIDGKYKVGDSFPPERALKERFSTTHITIRNALSRLVEEGYIERFSGRGTFVTYTGTEGKNKKSDKSVTAVHLVAGSFDPFFTAVMDKVEPELWKSGINLVIHAHRNDPIFIRAISEELNLHKDSISFYFFLETEITSRFAENIPENSVLIVPSDVDTAFSQIICEVYSGCYHAARYLSENSKTPPAYIGDKPSLADSIKLEGFASGLESAAMHVKEGTVAYSGGTGEGGRQACRSVLLRQPQCREFFCASDLIASGVSRCLKEKGLNKDTDYQITGFGATPLSDALDIPSVNLEHEKVSQVVLQNILDFKQTRKLTNTAAHIKTTFTIR